MARTLLPSRWKTDRLTVCDSTLEEAQELQQINDLLDSIRGWTVKQVDGQAVDRIQSALVDGVFPPNGCKDLFRLQSIHLSSRGQLIGFVGFYHGFPDAETLWMNVIAIHPSFQRQGYGSEAMEGLGSQARQTGTFARMRGYIWLENLPSLRFHVGVGFDRIVTVAEDKRFGGVHVLLEKAL
jgi:GNAT superfamily N-acetyltransferase